MSSRERDDPTLLLTIAAALLSVLAWRVLSILEADDVLSAMRASSPVLIAAGVTAVAVASARGVVTSRTLRSRSAVVVAPADEFDPSAEAVLRFAAQLSRVRRSVRGWLDRRASAVRVRLEPDSEGRLAYTLEVPGRSRELLRSALRSFEGVELRAPEDVVAESPELPATSVARAELVLARPSVEPLARLGLDPDPLDSFAGAVKGLRAAQGEEAVVCVDRPSRP